MADGARSAAVRILGVDPGLRRTGWGVIAAEGTRLSFVACGTVVSDERLSLAERLRQLHAGLTEVLAAWASDEVAVEETFVNKDAQATLKLGHARGVALLVPALAGLPVAEYPANLIKKTRGRRGPRREAADPGHGARAPAQGRPALRRRRRRARRRHHPRPFPQGRAA